MERDYLSRAACELKPKGLQHAALPFVASEYLADYKAGADAELQSEFAHFISGNNDGFLGKKGGGEYTPVPFVTPWDTQLCDAPDSEMHVLDRVSQKKIQWGNRSLLHIPGAHTFLSKDIIKRREFDAYIGALHYNGQQTMEQAWHYFKFIVKGAQPDKLDLESFIWRPKDDGLDDALKPDPGAEFTKEERAYTMKPGPQSDQNNKALVPGRSVETRAFSAAQAKAEAAARANAAGPSS